MKMRFGSRSGDLRQEISSAALALVRPAWDVSKARAPLSTAASEVRAVRNVAVDLERADRETGADVRIMLGAVAFAEVHAGEQRAPAGGTSTSGNLPLAFRDGSTRPSWARQGAAESPPERRYRAEWTCSCPAPERHGAGGDFKRLGVFILGRRSLLAANQRRQENSASSGAKLGRTFASCSMVRPVVLSLS